MADLAVDCEKRKLCVGGIQDVKGRLGTDWVSVWMCVLLVERSLAWHWHWRLYVDVSLCGRKGGRTGCIQHAYLRPLDLSSRMAWFPDFCAFRSGLSLPFSEESKKEYPSPVAPLEPAALTFGPPPP